MIFVVSEEVLVIQTVATIGEFLPLPQRTFSEMLRLSSCARLLMMVNNNSPFRGKLIQAQDESRLNPKAAWVRYRWVQIGKRL